VFECWGAYDSRFWILEFFLEFFYLSLYPKEGTCRMFQCFEFLFIDSQGYFMRKSWEIHKNHAFLQKGWPTSQKCYCFTGAWPEIIEEMEKNLGRWKILVVKNLSKIEKFCLQAGISNRGVSINFWVGANQSKFKKFF
jgi:hypothetical protein